jgi:hypothetical protein
MRRKGMGLIEYQAMPSLHDIVHYGGYSHLLYNSSWKFNLLAAVRYDTEKACGTDRPSHRKSHLPGHSPPASRRAAVLGQPSSLRPHWF